MEVVSAFEHNERLQQTVGLLVWGHNLALLILLALTCDCCHFFEDLRDERLLVLGALLCYKSLVLLLDPPDVGVKHVDWQQVVATLVAPIVDVSEACAVGSHELFCSVLLCLFSCIHSTHKQCLVRLQPIEGFNKWLSYFSYFEIIVIGVDESAGMLVHINVLEQLADLVLVLASFGEN